VNERVLSNWCQGCQVIYLLVAFFFGFVFLDLFVFVAALVPLEALDPFKPFADLEPLVVAATLVPFIAETDSVPFEIETTLHHSAQEPWRNSYREKPRTPPQRHIR